MPFGLTEWEANEINKDWLKMQDDLKRKEQLRIQALGAAISRRDWWAVEQAYSAIRDAFDRPEVYGSNLPLTTSAVSGKTRGGTDGPA